MLQILLADSNRGWQSLNEDPKRTVAVTTEDIQHVANLYFKPENQAIEVFPRIFASASAIAEILAADAYTDRDPIIGALTGIGSERLLSIMFGASPGSIFIRTNC
jgi:hypothetical protein